MFGRTNRLTTAETTADSGSDVQPGPLAVLVVDLENASHLPLIKDLCFVSLSTDLEYFGRTERPVTPSSVGPGPGGFVAVDHVWSVKVIDGDCGSQSFKKYLHDLYTRT